LVREENPYAVQGRVGPAKHIQVKVRHDGLGVPEVDVFADPLGVTREIGVMGANRSGSFDERFTLIGKADGAPATEQNRRAHDQVSLSHFNLVL